MQPGFEMGVIMFFKKKTKTKSYDAENKKPVIKASICNGEQVAGFQDIHTGAFDEVMLIRGSRDLDPHILRWQSHRSAHHYVMATDGKGCARYGT